MYTSHIGKRFVEIYNRRKNSEYTVKEFFETVFFPIFYGYPKFLNSPGNTPVFQLIISKKTGDAEERQKKKIEIDDKIEEYINSSALTPNMSFAIGYGPADDFGTTSGQITSLKLPVGAEEIYASWIGAGLGIGIAGGQNILFDHEEILWAIYEGWHIYRKLVNQTDEVDNKIDTWNGVWLAHRFSSGFIPDFPEDNLNAFSIGKNGEAKMDRPTWVELMMLLSLKFGGSALSAYVYVFSQTNTTVGFIQIFLPQIRRVPQIYDELFASSGIKTKSLAELYETEYGFIRACEYGTIGLRQMEPKGLKKYISASGGENLPTQKEYEKSTVQFNIYITWIVAMLNNKEFVNLAESTAKMLHKYAGGEKRAKTTRSNEVKEVINAKSKKAFIDALTVIVENEPTLAVECNTAVEAMHNDVPYENVQYFITLLKFKYSLFEVTPL